jgi:hypothetical protein
VVLCLPRPRAPTPTILKLAVCASLTLWSGTAFAAPSLEGHWQLVKQSDPTVVWNVAIDAHRRVLISGKDNAQQSKSWGYISQEGSDTVEVTLTNGKGVVQIRCTRQSVDFSKCDGISPQRTVIDLSTCAEWPPS